MAARSHLDWPWFDADHRALATRAQSWTAENVEDREPEDLDAACRSLVRGLGAAGLLGYCVPREFGGAAAGIDARSLCVIREALAYGSALADFAFALQGLGGGAISLGGSDELRRKYLSKISRGEAITAFALSEPDAGSDAAALTTRAQRDGDHYVLDGVKTWTSNGGIADLYVVFARTSADGGSSGISAFVVDAATPGLSVETRIEVIAAHPLATMQFQACKVPSAQRIGAEGEGFKLAMRTLDLFRPSVGAAAVGLARRACDEAATRANERRMFGATLGDMQLTQAALGDMTTAIDASALLVYRAAWLRDTTDGRITPEAAMAKMFATESAQRVIDRAVQMFGGLGVVRGMPVERLYRDIRALRIYEGATEVQQLLIGQATLASRREESAR